MREAVHLRTFSGDQLILSEEETRLVLEFFWPERKEAIEKAVITDGVRSFAQGLLVEAIDATYAMGYVDILFSALIAGILPSPDRTNAAVRIIKKFAEDAPSHWFKHATVHDLVKVKVYESVRKTIAWSFGSVLNNKLEGLVSYGPPTAFVNYASVFYQSNYYWG